MWLKTYSLWYIRGILSFAVLGKLFYSATFKTSLLSTLKYYSIDQMIPFEWIKYVLLAFYLTIIIVEFLIIMYSFSDPNKYKIISICFWLVIILYNINNYVFNIAGDCGCFGNVIEFKNDLSKIVFNLINAAVFYLSMIHSKEKQSTNNKDLKTI